MADIGEESQLDFVYAFFLLALDLLLVPYQLASLSTLEISVYDIYYQGGCQ